MNPTNNFAPIAALDLDPIKVKLLHKESGEGWSLAHANAIEFEYRRFLYLMKLFPHEQTAPLFDVDIFWHYHILDTMKYAADCERAFGYFLHHFPYSGLRGEDDEICRERSGARMQELYEATFGEAYMRQAAAPTKARCQRVAAKAAYCSPAAMAKAAYCSPAVMAQTAYCSPAVMTQTAYCSPAAMTQTAYCSPAAAPSPLTGAHHGRVVDSVRPGLA